MERAKGMEPLRGFRCRTWSMGYREVGMTDRPYRSRLDPVSGKNWLSGRGLLWEAGPGSHGSFQEGQELPEILGSLGL